MAKSDRQVVGDYFTLERGTTYKSRLLGQPGPVLLGLASIQRNGGFRRDSLQTYGGESPERLLVQPGGLYASLKDVTQSADLLGAVARVPFDHRQGRLTQDTVKLQPRSEDVPTSYLYWLLRTPQYRTYCRARATGTTTLGLARDDFLSFPAPAPTAVQQRLTELLEALENKIELNRRINETLDALTRALFKSWFVDFDPVRAKVTGQPTSGGSELLGSFPDKFEDSEFGSIPAGWRIATVGEVAEVIDCLHSKKPERLTFGKPLLQLGNIRDDGLVDMADSYWISEVDYEQWTSRMEARPGDCVITNVGRVGAVAQIPNGLRVALGRNMTGVRCRSEFPYPTFLVECLLSQRMRDEINLKVDTGTILDALNVRNIPSLRFVQPEGRIVEAFERIGRPLRARMETALTESRQLAALRDTLLPKLVSGELRVQDAERLGVEAGV